MKQKYRQASQPSHEETLNVQLPAYQQQRNRSWEVEQLVEADGIPANRQENRALVLEQHVQGNQHKDGHDQVQHPGKASLTVRSVALAQPGAKKEGEAVGHEPEVPNFVVYFPTLRKPLPCAKSCQGNGGQEENPDGPLVER